MTGRDLVTAALKLIGSIAPGESVTADEAVDGLASINRMIDSWSNEELLIYSVVREEFLLTAGDKDYTIGSGGNFNTTRPIRIESAAIKVGTIEYPLMLRTSMEYAEIVNKGLSSTIPKDLYYDPAYPLGIINLYPIPAAAYYLVLYSFKQISNIATIDTSISLPPGYERALVYNAAIELSPEYGKIPNELIFNTAKESKADLKRTNHKPVFLRCDSALIEKTSYDIETGDYI